MLHPRYYIGPKSPQLHKPQLQAQPPAPAAAPTPNPKLPPSANALKSGLSSLHPVHVALPGEERDFENFRRDMVAALAPRDPIAKALADEVIHGHWRLERAHRMEKALYDEVERSAGEVPVAQAQVEAFLEASQGLQRIALYIGRIERSLRRATAALEARQGECRAEIERFEREAVLITQLAAEDKSFDPAEHFTPEYCGHHFVYSREAIEQRIARAKRLERAESRFAAAAA